MATVREICSAALVKLLMPVAKFCLRHSLKQREVLELLKLAFVRVAREELERLSLPVTPSKISVMTGIQRRDVSRLLGDPELPGRDRDIVSRVIGLWETGRRYRDNAGRPRILSFTGREGDFADLVAAVSTDLNPYTVAFELERMKAVRQAEDSMILHQAVVENIFDQAPVKNIHVKTRFDNIPASFEAEVRSWFLRRAGEFHHDVREYLSSLDRDSNPEIKRSHAEEDAICASIVSVGLTTAVETEENRGQEEKIPA
jgi:Family of unknown function (DUF6502)